MLLVILGIILWLFSKPSSKTPESTAKSNSQVTDKWVANPVDIPNPNPPKSAAVSRPHVANFRGNPSSEKGTNYNYEIVGESYRRESLLKIINSHNAASIGKLHIEAELEPEPSNSFDKNAVRVLIDGKHVGYIPQIDSERVGNLIKKSGEGKMKVKARIGWDKNQNMQFIGVKIALDSDG